jgi:hypothetical protein
MFISEHRAVGLSPGVAQVRLANLVRDGWLDGASDAAYERGVEHLLKVGPLGDLPGASRLVKVRFLEPFYRDGTMTVGLRWETVGRTAGLFPVLDADLVLSAEGEHRTRVALTGCYRPPFGALGAGLDRALMRRVATMTIGSLLTRLADALENPDAAAETAGLWPWPDSGPQTAFE